MGDALEKYLSALRKEAEHVFAVDGPVDAVSSGSIAVDLATGIGGFPRGRLSEVFGWESCLAAHTQIHFTTFRPDAPMRPGGKGRRATNCKGSTIERLFERFHGLEPSGMDKRGRYPRPETAGVEFYAPSVNEDGRIFLNRILDVVATGVKPCYRITANGYVIEATADHKFLVEDRFLPVSELRPGMRASMHLGVPFRKADALRGRGDRRYLYVKSHGVAGLKTVAGGYTYHRLLRSRAVIEAEMNLLSLEEYESRLNKRDLEGLVFLAREDHVHHLDENYLNDSRGNLMVLKAGEHSRLHALQRHNNLRFATVTENISRIEVVGDRRTFDLKMASPFNNYVANGFVVHNSGKTTLCLQACAAAQHAGMMPAFLDVEIGTDRNHAARIGFRTDDPRRGVFLQPESIERTFTLIHDLALTGEVDLIIADSVAAMIPEEALKGGMESSPIAQQARYLSSMIPRLTKTIAATKVALVFVNQMRKTIATGYGAGNQPSESSAGGSALKFYSSLRINTTRVTEGVEKASRVDPSTGKPVEVATANLHRAKCFKNKVGTPYRSSSFLIRFDESRGLWGIDNIATIANFGVVTGFIERAGSHYRVGDESVNGVDALQTYLRENPAVAQEIAEKAIARLEQQEAAPLAPAQQTEPVEPAPAARKSGKKR